MNIKSLVTFYLSYFTRWKTSEYGKNVDFGMIIDFNEETKHTIPKKIFTNLKLADQILVINEKFKGINLSESDFSTESLGVVRFLKFISYISSAFFAITYLNNFLIHYYSSDSNPSSAIPRTDVPQDQVNSIKQAMSVNFDGNHNLNSSDSLTQPEKAIQPKSLLCSLMEKII